MLKNAVVAATVLLGSASAVLAEGSPKAVVELFTSQGCSSCPPADRILAGYSKRDDILALSWHVDYWNYIGWKDTFSKPEFTNRQYRYAASFNRRGVYTPQAVVNGRDHVVGSNSGKIEGLISTYGKQGKGLTVPVAATKTDGQIRIKTDVASGNATLWLVYFDRQKKVAIKRGENSGKTITYHNVVRDISMVGMMKDGKLDVTLPVNEMRRKGHEACALLLQETTEQGTPGPILGAAVIGDI